MFLTLLLVAAMLLGLGLVMAAVAAVAVAASLAGVGPDPLAFFSRPPALWLGALVPVFIAFLVWIVVSVGIGNALIWGAVARMWRQLNPDDPSRTFA